MFTLPYLIYHNGSTSQAYSGSQYYPVGGTARLNIRTGTNTNDILEYGFTTDATASAYGSLKFRIKEQDAWIGRSDSGTHSYSYQSLTKTEPVTQSYTASYVVSTAKTYRTQSTALSTATLIGTVTTAAHTRSSQYTQSSNTSAKTVTTTAYTRSSLYTANSASGTRISTSATLTRTSQYTASTNTSAKTITTATFTRRASTRLTSAQKLNYSHYHAYCRTSSTYSNTKYNTQGGSNNPTQTSSSTRSYYTMPFGSGISRTSYLSSNSTVNNSIMTVATSYYHEITYITRIYAEGTSRTLSKASYCTNLSSVSSTGTVLYFYSDLEIYSTGSSVSAYGTSQSRWTNYTTSTRASTSGYATRSSGYTNYTTSTRASASRFGTSLSKWTNYTTSTRASTSGYATGTSITGYATIPNYTISETTAIHSLYTSMSSVSSHTRHNFNL